MPADKWVGGLDACDEAPVAFTCALELAAYTSSTFLFKLHVLSGPMAGPPNHGMCCGRVGGECGWVGGSQMRV